MGPHCNSDHRSFRLYSVSWLSIVICVVLSLHSLDADAASLGTNAVLFNDSMFAGREKLKVPSAQALPLWTPVRAFLLDRRSALRPGVKDWARWAAKLRPQPLHDKLAAINQRVNNGFHYASDTSLWQKDDYWESPAEAVRRDGIDCEGFAIFKMYLASLAGIPLTDMSIAVGRLSNRSGMHAVLVVTDGQRAFVLDNLQSPVIEPRQFRSFQPAAMIGMDEAWVIPRNLVR